MEYLPSYVAALERGWSPDTIRAEAGREEPDQVARDPVGFVAEEGSRYRIDLA